MTGILVVSWVGKIIGSLWFLRGVLVSASILLGVFYIISAGDTSIEKERKAVMTFLKVAAVSAITASLLLMAIPDIEIVQEYYGVEVTELAKHKQTIKDLRELLGVADGS